MKYHELLEGLEDSLAGIAFYPDTTPPIIPEGYRLRRAILHWAENEPVSFEEVPMNARDLRAFLAKKSREERSSKASGARGGYCKVRVTLIVADRYGWLHRIGTRIDVTGDPSSIMLGGW